MSIDESDVQVFVDLPVVEEVVAAKPARSVHTPPQEHRDSADAQDIEQVRQELATAGKLIFTVAEVATLLGMSTSTVYEALRTGQLTSLRFGRKIVIPAAPILAMLGIQR